MGERRELDQHAEAACERWFGAQAAASFLGLHRSTLFLAVQRKHLIPDRFTPGGHARFRQTTLEAFRSRIAKEAVTSEAPLYAPVKSLTTLAQVINNVAPLPKPTRLIHDKDISDEVRKVCASAVMAITDAPLHVETCLIALRVADQRDPFALRTAAQHGVARGFLRDYEWLRHQPNTSFATLEALKTRTPIFCPDTSAPLATHNGSAKLIKEYGIGSYAILPIVGGEDAVGVLFLIEKEPRTFTTHEMMFLSGVTEQVATAVTNQNRADRLAAYAQTGRDLTQLALTLRAQGGAAGSSNPATTPIRPHDALRQLLGVFLKGSEAMDVCALGFEGGDAPGESAELNELTDRVWTHGAPMGRPPRAADGASSTDSAAPNANQCERRAWMSKGQPVSALAISVPLGGQRRGAVGALWRRPEWPDEDHLLLVTLAGACAMVASPA